MIWSILTLKSAGKALWLLCLIVFGYVGTLVSGHVQKTEVDLKKMPELKPFFVGNYVFFEGAYDRRQSKLNFIYSTTFPNNEVFFSAMDEAALEAGWQIMSKDEVHAVYGRNSRSASSSESTEVITVNYDSTGRTVEIEVVNPKLADEYNL